MAAVWHEARTCIPYRVLAFERPLRVDRFEKGASHGRRETLMLKQLLMSRIDTSPLALDSEAACGSNQISAPTFSTQSATCGHVR
jgi:hypothetical protein